MNGNQQLYTCINYIHNNPVKAGICKIASEYEYSSYNEYIENKEKIQKNINGVLIKEDKYILDVRTIEENEFDLIVKELKIIFN